MFRINFVKIIISNIFLNTNLECILERETALVLRNKKKDDYEVKDKMAIDLLLPSIIPRFFCGHELKINASLPY